MVVNQCSGNSLRRARIRHYLPLHLKRLWPKYISETKKQNKKQGFLLAGRKEQNIYNGLECKDKKWTSVLTELLRQIEIFIISIFIISILLFIMLDGKAGLS